MSERMTSEHIKSSELTPTKEGAFRVYCVNCRRNIAVDLETNHEIMEAKRKHRRESLKKCEMEYFTVEKQRLSHL